MLRRDMNGHCTRLTPNWGRVGVVGKQALPPNNWCSSLAGHGSGSEVPLWNPLCHAFCAQRKCQKEEEEDPSRDSVVKWVRDVAPKYL